MLMMRTGAYELANTNTLTHTPLQTLHMQKRLKVAVLIKHIKLTTDVIDQKANSSSIIVSEERTIAK